MNPDPKRVEAIFAAVLEQTPASRTAYLTEACGGDEALRQRVEALLKAHGEAGNFLAKPVLEPAGQDMALASTSTPKIAEAPTLGIAAAAPSGSSAATKVRYFGDYELGAEIARGGMGVVYRATQVSLKRPVALKMILAGQLAAESDVQRFQREAEAAANLDHPNIVPIYEVGQHEGLHYFTMKLIEGTSLAERSSSFVRDPKAAVKILAKVAHAVYAAHQHGILHRDLKPSNILLDAHDEPFVTDFGLAKHVDGLGAQTRSGVIVGTPSYMSPEQARSEKSLTVAVDVYGLGAILYELLTGRPPFRAESGLETILQVLDRDPPNPRTLNGRIDRDLETICLKCLDKQPKSRYSSALALAEDLERWLAGHTILARPSNPAKKVFKWAKRNPALAALLVVLPLWYLNVRLPWQWAWLDWIWLGVLLLVGLSRLVIAGRRAMGKSSEASFDPALDLFWLPGAVAALLALCFYPGELADRKSLAYAIVLIAFSWGYVIQWLGRRVESGSLLVALRSPLPFLIIFGACFGIFSIDHLAKLINVSEQTGDRFVYVGTQLQSLSVFVFLFLQFAVGIEIRKQGCVTFFTFVRWQEIESFDWRQTQRQGPHYSLFLRLKLRYNPLPLEKAVHPAKRDMVDRLLLEHVPRSEPVITTSSDALPALTWDEREPADRLGGPALLLIVSGIMQIAGAMALAILLVLAMVLGPGWNDAAAMAPIIAVLLLLFALVGLLAGAIVVAGAVNMRRLKNYRFCRRSALLAMLPLGCGFPLGLPFGVWALLVLRRADVQAAFAGNDGRRAGRPGCRSVMPG